MIGTILSAIASPISNGFQAWNKRKETEREMAGEVAKAKVNYKIRRYELKTKRLEAQADRDLSYDMQVLRNRQHTWVDEFIVVAVVGITLLAFLPWTQPYVKEGWDAVADAPFWFQFAWITVIVSTLGGLTILRILKGTAIKQTVNAGRSSRQDIPPQPSSPPHSQSESSQSATEEPTDESESTPYPFEDRRRN